MGRPGVVLLAALLAVTAEARPHGRGPRHLRWRDDAGPSAAEVKTALEGLGRSDPAVCALAVDRSQDGWSFHGGTRLLGEEPAVQLRRGPVKDPPAGGPDR